MACSSSWIEGCSEATDRACKIAGARTPRNFCNLVDRSGKGDPSVRSPIKYEGGSIRRQRRAHRNEVR
jgi:hypothetical protein